MERVMRFYKPLRKGKYMSENIPKAVWEGELNICGVKIRCAVLDDGRRVFNADDIHEFFNSEHIPTKEEADSLARFARGYDA